MAKGDFAPAVELWAAIRAGWPDDPVGWTQNAMALMMAGRAKEAQPIMAEAVERFAGRGDVLGMAIRIANAVGDWPWAEVVSRQMVGVDPGSVWARRMLAGSLTARLRWDEADAVLREAMARAPDALELPTALAWNATKRRDWPAAEARWREVEARASGQAEVALGLAEVRLGEGRFDEARAVLGKVPAGSPQAPQVARLAARIDSAEKEWRTAEAARGEGEQRREAAQKLRARGEAALARRDWQDAAAAWAGLSAQEPLALDARMYVVQLRRLLGEDDAADRALAEAMDVLVAQAGEAVEVAEALASGAPAELVRANNLVRLEAYTRQALGWPETPRMARYRNALVTPQNRWTYRPEKRKRHVFRAVFNQNAPILNGGAYGEDGRSILDSFHFSTERAYIPELVAQTDGPPDELPGRWLYGGPMHRHFGQFLVESLGRLWAVPELAGEIEGVVFFCGDVEGPGGQEAFSEAELQAWAAVVANIRQTKEAHRIFAPKCQIKLITRPVRVAELVVSSQLSGFDRRGPEIVSGHERHRRHIRQSVDAAFPQITQATEKLYVSRSKMPLTSGFFFREELFERNLQQQGYRVVHPQFLSLGEQISLYRSASHVILGSGSACHVLALAVDGRQRLAVLERDQEPNPIFTAQLRAMGGEVLTIDAWDGEFQPAPDAGPGARWIASHRVIVAVDWGAVWARLQEAGFVDGPPADDGLASQAQVEAEMRAQLRQDYGFELAISKTGRPR